MELKRFFDARPPKKPLDIILLWLLSVAGLWIVALVTVFFVPSSSPHSEVSEILFDAFQYIYYLGFVVWLWLPRKFPLWWFSAVALITIMLSSAQLGFLTFLCLVAYFDYQRHFAKQSFKYKQVNFLKTDRLIKNNNGQLLSKHILTQHHLPIWYQMLVRQKLYFQSTSKNGFNGPPLFVLADQENIRLIKVRLTPHQSLDTDFLSFDPHHKWDDEYKQYYLDGYHTFYALDLVYKSTEYRPSGLLIFIPAMRSFATYDQDHDDVYLYPKLKEHNFFKHLGACVSGQWNYRNQAFPLNEQEFVHLYRLSPWQHFTYVEEKENDPFINDSGFKLVLAEREMIFNDKPVLCVKRDAGGDWRFLAAPSETGNTRFEHINARRLIESDPALLETQDLMNGWVASREEVGGEWKRSKIS